MAQHHHLVGQLRDHRQVMADDQQRGAARLDLLEYLENLRLHRGVQRGGRLIGDHQRRVQGQGTGNQRTLAQATGQLPGALTGAQLDVGHPDLLKQLMHPCCTRLAVAVPMGLQHFENFLAHRPQGVE